MKKTYELEIVTKDFTHTVQSVILPPGVFNQPDLQNLAFLIGEREEIGNQLSAKNYFQNISELRLMGMVHISAPGEENLKEKRHRYKEQSFGLCGRGRGWDDLGEWH